MTKAWIGVASRDHVQRGVRGGFMQLNHGKKSSLLKMQPGDFIAYYSPRLRYEEDEPCQAFTALGAVGADAPYQVEMMATFTAWRRSVTFFPSEDAPALLLKSKLDFIQEHPNWGMLLRRGHFEISLKDLRTIAKAMRVQLPRLST